MPETKKASCLFCSLQCGFAMEMDAGVPVRVDFDTEARQNKGSLCVRGHYNHELLTHPKRFLAATVNRRRVPWTSGVTKVAGGLAEIKESHGGDAVGVIVGTELSNEDYDATAAFAAGVLGTANVAVAYDGSDFPLLMGGGAGDATPEDLDSADCFVLVGDVFWGHPCVAKRAIAARHEARSNRIFTINPYRTNTDWFADRQMTVSPGAEPVVLAGLLRAMNAQGAPDVSVAKAADAAGMSEAEFQSIASNIREHHKVVVLVSSRLGDSVAGYLTGSLAAALARATGGKYGPLFRGGNAIGASERIGSRKTVPDILKGVAGGTIKGLIVLGPDILQLYPGALGADDIEGLSLLAASSVFENDVTKHSDVGLPQTVWTETEGSYSASFGIATSMSPVAAPQGDATSVAEMLAKIASGMGASLGSAKAVAEHPPVEIDVSASLARLAAPPSEDGLRLIECISPLHRWDGTITGRMSFAQSISPYCDVWIGEESAAERGVGQGATVALSTDRGETHIIATVTGRMPNSLVAIPSYVPDARGLLTWTANAGTRWFDVSASTAKVTPEA
ncbi:MAG: molybdopterin-dependent oxidoreductase [Candidatus Eisenbacteria bacterium]